MTNQDFDDVLNSELESRLDDLFGEEEEAADILKKTEQPKKDYPLAELKSLVLSIDWEITDDVLEKFLRQIKILKATYRKNKIILMFLQILGALADYIKTNRGKAHPKTFKILNSVFSQLDKLVLAKGMTESEKKKILNLEIKKFNALKLQILQNKSADRQKKQHPPAETKKSPVKIPPEEVLVIEPGRSPKPVKKEAAVSEAGQLTAEDALADAVKEIKKFIHAEFKTLREELILLRKRQ